MIRPLDPDRVRRLVRRFGLARSLLVAALLPMIVLGAIALSVWWWRTARIGRLDLRTDPFAQVQSAELVDPRTEAVLVRSYLPTALPLEAPAGSYMLRIGAAACPSRTYQVVVQAGITRRLWIPPSHGRVLDQPTISMAHAWPLKSARGNDLILNTLESLQRVGSDGRQRWYRPLPKSDPNRGVDDLGLTRLEAAKPAPAMYAVGDSATSIHRWAVESIGDTDGDREADMLWVRMFPAEQFVVSSRTGEVIWNSRTMATASQPHPYIFTPGRPVLIGDVDSDGVIDAVVPYQVMREDLADRTRLICGIRAISCRTGRTLWRFIPPESGGPSDANLFCGSARRDGRDVVAATVGSRVEWLDPRDGRPAFPPTALGGVAAVAPIIRDPDGDRNADVVALTTTPTAGEFTLAAIATKEGRGQVAWTARIAGQTNLAEMYLPRLVELDGDTIPEVLIPATPGPSRPHVAILDGGSGQIRWRQGFAFSPLANFGTTLDQTIEAGCDIDRDGYLDLIRARSLVSRIGPGAGPTVEVEAIRGGDGRTIWLRRLPRLGRLLSAFTWSVGADGLPRIGLAGTDAQGSDATWLLAASTGRVDGIVEGTALDQRIDLDGDGDDELIGTRDRLTAIASPPPALWRRLDPLILTREDVDRDGMNDVIADPSGTSYRFPSQVVARWGDLDRPPGPTWKSPNRRREVLLHDRGRMDELLSDEPVSWRPHRPTAIGAELMAIVPNATWKAPILLESGPDETIALPMIPMNSDGERTASWLQGPPIPEEPPARSAFPLPWRVNPMVLPDLLTGLARGALLLLGILYVPLALVAWSRRMTRSGALRLMGVTAALAIVLATCRLVPWEALLPTGWTGRPQVTTTSRGPASTPTPFSPGLPLAQWLRPDIAPLVWILATVPITELGRRSLGLIARERWGRLAKMSGAIAALSGIIGAVWLAFDPVPPGGWRAWDCWWLLPAGVAYGVGFAAIPVGIVRSAARAIRSRWATGPSD